jgi:hypothetical protein
MTAGKGRMRARISAVALLVALGGGTFGIDALASHLSSMVAHSESSASASADPG